MTISIESSLKQGFVFTVMSVFLLWAREVSTREVRKVEIKRT